MGRPFIKKHPSENSDQLLDIVKLLNNDQLLNIVKLLDIVKLLNNDQRSSKQKYFGRSSRPRFLLVKSLYQVKAMDRLVVFRGLTGFGSTGLRGKSRF